MTNLPGEQLPSQALPSNRPNQPTAPNPSPQNSAAAVRTPNSSSSSALRQKSPSSSPGGKLRKLKSWFVGNWILIILITLVLGGGFFAYYRYLAKSLLILSVTPKDAVVKIDGVETKRKFTFLKRGVHDLAINKDGYLTDYRMAKFSPLGIKWEKIALNQMFNVSLVRELQPESLLTVETAHLTCNRQTGDLIFLGDDKFKIISQAEINKSDDVVNENGKSLELPLTAEEIANIQSVNYSPDSTQAFVKSGKPDNLKIMWLNFKIKALYRFEDNIIDVAWLSETGGIALQKSGDGSVLSRFTPGKSDFQKLADAPAGSLILNGATKDNTLIITLNEKGTTLYRFDLTNNTANTVNLAPKSVLPLPWNEKYSLVSVATESKSEIQKLENGQYTPTGISVGSAYGWTGDSLVVAKPTKTGVDFISFNPADNSTKLLKSYSQIGSEIEEMAICQKTVYFVDQEKIIGFPLE